MSLSEVPQSAHCAVQQWRSGLAHQPRHPAAAHSLAHISAAAQCQQHHKATVAPSTPRLRPCDAHLHMAFAQQNGFGTSSSMSWNPGQTRSSAAAAAADPMPTTDSLLSRFGLQAGDNVVGRFLVGEGSDAHWFRGVRGLVYWVSWSPAAGLYLCSATAW